MTIIQIWKTIKEGKFVSKLRIIKLLVFATLFLLTFYRDIPNRLIENADWKILKNKRVEIVENVKEGKLNPNVEYNGIICELPFELPVVSNGGNDIWITRYEEKNQLTVKFWIFRNFFDSPQKLFVFSNNPDDIKSYEDMVNRNPSLNWKIEENWYRIVER